MEKERIIKKLEEEIEYIGLNHIFELDNPEEGGYEHETKEIDLGENWTANVAFEFWGKFRHDNGDYNNEPSDSGSWYWDITSIEVTNEIGERVEMDFDLAAFSGDGEF